MKIWRSIVIVFVTTAVLLGCAPEKQSPLRLGTNVWPGYEPLYLSQGLGFLAKDEVRLVQLTSASDVIRSFKNGALEMASLTLDEALRLVELDIPIKVILVHDSSYGGDAIVAKPGIKTIKDLAGKKVAVEGSLTGAYVLARAMEIHDINFEQISVVQLDVSDHIEAFSLADVDAVVTFEPSLSKLLTMGAHEVFSSKDIPGEILDVLVVRTETYEKNPEKLKRLIDAWFSALEFMKNNPEQAAALMAPRLGLSPEGVLKSFSGLRMLDKEENRALFSGSPPKIQSNARRLKIVMQDQKLLSRNIDLSDLFAEDLWQGISK